MFKLGRTKSLSSFLRKRESSAFLNPGFRLASAIADLAGMTPILVKNYSRKHQRRPRAITFATFIVAVTAPDAGAGKFRTAIPQPNLHYLSVYVPAGKGFFR